jgi:hypothetical protein
MVPRLDGRTATRNPPGEHSARNASSEIEFHRHVAGVLILSTGQKSDVHSKLWPIISQTSPQPQLNLAFSQTKTRTLKHHPRL